MKHLFIYFLFLFLLSCGGSGDKEDKTATSGDKKTITNNTSQVTGAFTCVCDKDGSKEDIGADNPKEAESQCTAKGEGYKITSCKKS